jgi:hypothetical protein
MGIEPSISTSKDFEITAHEDLLPNQNFFFRAEKNAKGIELELDARLRRRCQRLLAPPGKLVSTAARTPCALVEWWGWSPNDEHNAEVSRENEERRKKKMASGVHASVTGRGDAAIYMYSYTLQVGPYTWHMGPYT